MLAEIKEDPELKHIPVVVLTTSTAEQDVHRTYHLHANCYINKPVDFEQFIEVVKSVGDSGFLSSCCHPGRQDERPARQNPSG